MLARLLIVILFLATSSAASADPATQPANAPRPAVVSDSATYPFLNPEDRPAKAKLALDPATDARTRFDAVWGLAISGYSPESATALTKIALDPAAEPTLRKYACMGISNFSTAMPADVRESIRKQFLAVIIAETADQRSLTNDGLGLLIDWGHADLVDQFYARQLRGDLVEIELLTHISAHDRAVKRLNELLADADLKTDSGWNQRWRIGAALIQRKEIQGIDILIECLAVKDPWPVANPTPQTEASNLASFHQCQHNLFHHLSLLFHENFDYQISGNWKPALTDAIPQMLDWWKTHRATWTFPRPATRPAQY